jgi:putative flippase GtrA
MRRISPKFHDLRQTAPSRAPAALRRLRPRSGLVGQGARFVLAGIVVAIVYLSLTTFFALVVGLPFQAALALGFCFALAVHFTLQRLFVWTNRDAFALPFHHQAGRYLLVTGAQYGMTAASTALLPTALGVPTEAVYLLTAPLLALSNFFVFRHVVFHGARAGADSARRE